MPLVFSFAEILSSEHSRNKTICLNPFLGLVYDYDETGVHRNVAGWSQCVAVPVVKNTRDPTFTYMWDAKLHEFTLQADWAPDRHVLRS